MSQLKPDGFPVYGANGPIGYTDEFTHEEPTILVGCRGSCGSVHVTAPCSYANGNAMALDSLDVSRVHIRFLARFLEHRGFRDVTTGTSQPQIIAQNIVRVTIPLPSLSEQRRLAEILDKADALRTRRKTARNSIDTVAQSIFLDMFGDPGTNPKAWPVAALRSLGLVTTGSTPPSAKAGMFGGAIPFVTPGDLESDEPVRRTVTEQGAAESRTVEAGATLVCCIGATIGKMGQANTRSAFNQQINAIDWGEHVDSEYGLAVMRFFKPTVVAWGSSTTLPILKKSTFERIEVPVPPLQEQRLFAERMKALDRLRGISSKGLERTNDLFSALQAQAFRGEL